MDETTKILIGTISGFIIAFLAEPVKTYFQTRIRINSLRLMLYKEITTNYRVLETAMKDNRSRIETQSAIKNLIRREGYQSTLSNNIELFYQLKEATAINHIYTSIDFLLNEPVTNKKVFRIAVKTNLLVVVTFIQSGELDKKLINKILGKSKFDEINANGKEF